jgi:hypothetical protein
LCGLEIGGDRQPIKQHNEVPDIDRTVARYIERSLFFGSEGRGPGALEDLIEVAFFRGRILGLKVQREAKTEDRDA